MCEQELNASVKVSRPPSCYAIENPAVNVGRVENFNFLANLLGTYFDLLLNSSRETFDRSLLFEALICFGSCTSGQCAYQEPWNENVK